LQAALAEELIDDSIEFGDEWLVLVNERRGHVVIFVPLCHFELGGVHLNSEAIALERDWKWVLTPCARERAILENRRCLARAFKQRQAVRWKMGVRVLSRAMEQELVGRA